MYAPHRVDDRAQSAAVRAIARRALVSGSVASLSSAAVLALCSQLEEGSPVGALNGPCQWFWGEAEAYTRLPSFRHTAVGYSVHHFSSILWATMYELVSDVARRAEQQAPAQRPRRSGRVIATAAAIAATAYFVDYTVTPRRMRPGFRKHLSSPSIWLAYAAFAAGLAATALTIDRAGRLTHAARDLSSRRGV